MEALQALDYESIHDEALAAIDEARKAQDALGMAGTWRIGARLVNRLGTNARETINAASSTDVSVLFGDAQRRH